MRRFIFVNSLFSLAGVKMADPVSATLMGGLAVGAVYKGLAGAAAQKTEARQLEYQAAQRRLRASQISHSQREQLNEGLATFRVGRASRGLRDGSRASFVQSNTIRRRAETNENAAVLGEKFQEQQLLSNAAAKRRAAPFMVVSGITNAARTLASPQFAGAVG